MRSTRPLRDQRWSLPVRRGGYRDDLVAGGPGNDALDAGPGADELDARDGRKDTIVIRPGEGDVVYYDEGLDVLAAPASNRAPAA